MAEAPAQLMVEGLRLDAGERTLLHGVDLRLHAGSIVALVGSSGAGKSLLAKALAGLVRPRPGVVAGSVTYLGPWGERRPFEGLRPGDDRAFDAAFQPLRGHIVAYVPQSATGALDPTRSVATQLRSALRGGDLALDASSALQAAGFHSPEGVLPLFPHELSGGMAQRVALALALAREARFLLVDEPTTGLDPRARQRVLSTLGALRARGVGVLLITHDLRQVPGLADEVLFMHGGRVIERAPGAELRRATTVEARALVDATARINGGAW